MYLLGLVFIGFNWSDYQIINDLILAYDSLKLYILSIFNQDSDFVKDKVIKTESEIKEIIKKENQVIDNSNNDKIKTSKKVIIEKVDNEKSLFKSLREKYKNTDDITIGDGKGNEWSFRSFITDPKTIIIAVSLIIISGAIVISIYDVTLDQITHFPLNVAKWTWASISLLFWKLINIFRRGGGGNDNDNDNDSDIGLNAGPALGIYDIRFIPEGLDASDRFLRPDYIDARTWLDLMDSVDYRLQHDPKAIIISREAWLRKLAEASMQNVKFTSQETNQDILDSYSKNSPDSSGSITPTNNTVDLAEEADSFEKIAFNRDLKKRGSSLQTPIEQSQYFKNAQTMNLVAKLLMNSLYGRFGMKNIDSKSLILNREELNNYYLKNHVISEDKLDKDLYLVEVLDESINTDSSVSISSSITSYSRIHMQLIKEYCINNGIKIYYFDTDSLITDKPLPDNFVSDNILGKLKLEYKIIEGVFLGPKIYGFSYLDNEGNTKQIIKIKGYKDSNKLSLDQLKDLLIENNSLFLKHTKWFRLLDLSQIKMTESPYQLTATQNKRKLIYIEGLAVDTVPFKIDLINKSF